MRSAWRNVQNASNVTYPDAIRRTSLPPTRWWRARSPHDFSRKDIRTIREFLLRHERVADCDWLGAVGGDPATAVGIAIKGLQRHGLKNPVTDAVISAILCCALEGDPTAKMVLISALRRRAKSIPFVTCVAAPNIAPFRLPTLTPAQRPNSKWIQALTACQTGSILGAGWGSKAAPIDMRSFFTAFAGLRRR